MSKLPDGFYHLTPHSDELKPSKAINKKKLTIIDQNRTDYNIRFEGKLQQKVYIYYVYIQKERKKDKIRGLSFGNPTVILW